MHFHVLPVGPGRQHSPHQLVMVTTPVIILVIPDDWHKAEIAPVFMPLLRQRPQVHVLVLAHAPEQGHGVAVPGFLKEFHQAFHLSKPVPAATSSNGLSGAAARQALPLGSSTVTSWPEVSASITLRAETQSGEAWMCNSICSAAGLLAMEK